MKRILTPARVALSVFLILTSCAHSVFAWDYEAHRVANQIALASLPTNYPAFVFTPEAAERIAFLAGEPDRWRNVSDLPLKHCNGPDHYIDMEELGDHGLKPETLPPLRYDFIALLATNRAAQPGRFPAINPAQNADHTRELVGLLPWAITENYGKLKSGFACLNAYELYGGTPDEIANAKADIIYVMGVMGHYVADAAQPLHTTMHHAGWAGENPHGYRTDKSFHQWIDGGYFGRTGLPALAELKQKIRPAHPVQFGGREALPESIFPATVEFIGATFREVVPLYKLDKEGALSGNGSAGLRGREFLTGRLLAGGQMLGDLWLSAWRHAPHDDFLKGQLEKRSRAAKKDAVSMP